MNSPNASSISLLASWEALKPPKTLLPAIIMAAGRGNRLLPLTATCPKCMLKIGRVPLLEYQLQALYQLEVPHVEIIVGFNAHKIEALAQKFMSKIQQPSWISLSHNLNFDTTSSLYSFGCTSLEPRHGFFILNSDVFFHPDLLHKLWATPYDQVLLVDFKSQLGDEEMKLCINEKGILTAISKSLDPQKAHAENLGILKVGQATAQALLALARLPHKIQLERGLLWLPDAINTLLNQFDFYACGTEGLPWTEIDFIHDLHKARQVILPRIRGTFSRKAPDGRSLTYSYKSTHRCNCLPEHAAISRQS